MSAITIIVLRFWNFFEGFKRTGTIIKINSLIRHKKDEIKIVSYTKKMLPTLQ